MRIQKVLILLLFPFVAEIVISCCDCPDTTSFADYSNDAITVYNLDNSGESPVVSFASSLSRNAYGIRVNLNRKIVAIENSTVPTFFQSAYAFSDCECPPENTYMPVDSIISVKVFTIYDFDDTHAAESDVTEYFRFFDDNFYRTTEEFLNPYGFEFGYSSWVLHDQQELNPELTLLLMHPPQLSILNKFRVQFTLSDGRVLEKETDEINLL